VGIANNIFGAYWLGTQAEIDRFKAFHGGENGIYSLLLPLEIIGTIVFASILPESAKQIPTIAFGFDSMWRVGSGCLDEVQVLWQYYKAGRIMEYKLRIYEPRRYDVPGIIGGLRELVQILS
jgi:hypothetical protein